MLCTRSSSLSRERSLSRLDFTCFFSRLLFRVEALFCLEDRPPLDLRVLELLTCFLSLLAGLAAGVLPALAFRLLVERTADVRPFLGLDREAFDDLLEDA